MKQKNTKTITKGKRAKRLLAGLLTFAMAATMGSGLLPSGTAQAAVNTVAVSGSEKAEDPGFFERIGEGIADGIAGIGDMLGLGGENEDKRKNGDKDKKEAENGEVIQADPSTLNTWEGYSQASTQNVGRIWSDKTVSAEDIELTGSYTGTIAKNGADFLVGLSALSSTSNLTVSTTVSRPLDIVLVLDNSTSMSDSQLAQLKEAANSFIDSVAEISDGDVQHRIAAVTFAGGAETIFGLENCNNSTAVNLKSRINAIKTKGGSSEYVSGVNAAGELLESSGNGRIPIAIVIGDGDPGGVGNLNPEWTGRTEANQAISSAAELKGTENARVYSVGIFAQADKEDVPPTPDNNKLWNNIFMHELSSNYPDAQALDNAGERAPDSDFYFAGQDYDELGDILQQILGQISEESSTGSPIEETTSEGAGNTPGILTFTDELGEYMEISGDTMTLVYADQSYEGKTSDGGKTFKFEGTIGSNGVYPDADLADLEVTVDKGNTLAKGDTVTVKMPASMIPLRKYEVTSEDGETRMEVTPAYPVRLFYGVSVKEEALSGLSDPDDTLKGYIDKHKNDAGQVSFYSNKWDGNENRGNTTAEFTPSDTNRFYYFTEDTLLYKDQMCTQPAKGDDINTAEDFYYKNPYYYIAADGSVKYDIEKVKVSGNGFEAERGYWAVNDEGNVYIKAGAPHLTRANDFYRDKDENITNTSNTVINPAWKTEGSEIAVYLGNNGRINAELPAALAITKNITVADGIQQDKFSNTEFHFDITVNGAAGEYEAEIKNADDTVVREEDFTVTFNNSKAEQTIKPGQTLYIYGLAAESTYEVKETDLPGGFTQITPEENKAASGTLAAGETAKAQFTNHYTAEGTLGGAAGLEVTKNLTGRGNNEWLESDAFSFKLAPDTTDAATKAAVDAGNIILKDGAESETITIDSSEVGHKKAFSDITFKQPGTFKFKVNEVMPEGVTEETNWTKDGITYDTNVKTVTVEVTDNGSGTLSAALAENSEKLTFTNKYEMTEFTVRAAYFQLAGNKTLQGRNWEDGDSFTFTLTPGRADDINGNEIPQADVLETMPTRTSVTIEPFTDESKVTDSTAKFSFSSDDSGTGPNIDEFTFKQPGTYRYLIKETNPNASEGGSGILGVSYDETIYRLTVTVADNGSGALKVENYAYSKQTPGENEFTPLEEGEDITFINKFSTEEIEVNFNAAKILSGRGKAMTENEFGFKIEGVGSKITGSEEEFAADPDMPMPAQTEVGNIIRGDVIFQGIEFTHDDAGKTYQYAITEKQPTKDGTMDGEALEGAVKNDAGQWVYKGVTYDNRTKYLTAEVTSESKTEGSAQVEIVRVNTSGEASWKEEQQEFTGEAIFRNTYQATGTIGADRDCMAAINAEKILSGRDIVAEEFSFNVFNTKNKVVAAGKNGAPIGGKKQTANITFADISVDSGSFAKDVQDGIAVKNPDGTYTYTYTVKEDTENLPGGVTAVDNAKEFSIDIVIKDDNAGKLTAVVNYPAGSEDKLTFKNIYGGSAGGTDDSIEFKGAKVLSNPDNLSKAPALEDIEGKYTFTLTGKAADDGTAAPMPKGAQDGTKTVTNAADGSIDFGAIEYTVANVWPEDQVVLRSARAIAERSKTFEYTIKESGTVAGVTNDADAEKTVKVTVTDDGAGNLEVTTEPEVSADGVLFTFTNTYSAQAATGVPADFTITKKFEGREWIKDYAFDFRLEAVTEGAPMPEKDGVVQDTVTVNGPTKGSDTAEFNFGDITYTKEGSYKYKVTEVVPAGDKKNPGITYAANPVEVTVTVSDNGNGQLVASAVVAGQFVNTYNTGSVDYNAAGGLEITKELTGHAMEDGQFEFVMKATNNEAKALFNDLYREETHTVRNAAAELGGGAGEISTDTIRGLINKTFTKDDIGTYTFEVSETDSKAKGYTYDGRIYTVTIDVSDDGQGTLKVKTTAQDNKGGELIEAEYTGSAAAAREAEPITLTFENSYDAGSVTVGGDGDIAIEAVKKLSGRDMTAGEFKFSVKNAKDPTGTVIATGENGADGKIVFTGIEYTMKKLLSDAADGLAESETTEAGGVYSYQYTISEDESNFEDGVTGTATAFSVTVKVTDNGEGGLSAEVIYPEGGVVFENVYGASAKGEIALKGSKVLNVGSGDNIPDITGKYEFTVSGSEGAPMPENTTVRNDAAGNVDFGKITYTMENVFGESDKAENETEAATENTAGDTTDEATDNAADSQSEIELMKSEPREKTFTYTISETGKSAGVTNDKSKKTVKVTVTDNGDGTIKIAKVSDESAADGMDFTFTNTYNVIPTDPSSPTADGGVKVTKKLNGRTLKDGEFTFEMKAVGENAAKVSPEKAEAKNKADGTVSLPGVTFKEPGTYSFDIYEVIPDEITNGVTYDGTIYQAKAAVTDNGDGTMSVEWTVTANGTDPVKEAVFTNTYEADATSVTLGAAKTLKGRNLKPGEFTFELKDGDGETAAVAKNNENGTVEFAAVEFTKEGTYNYTISELKGSDKTITYDDTVYKVTITVTDSGKGYLEAAVDNGGKSIVFNNTYTEPSEPVKPEETDKPSDTGKAEKENTKPAAVKTGDTSPVIPAIAAMAAALAAIAAVVVIIMRRRRR